MKNKLIGIFLILLAALVLFCKMGDQYLDAGLGCLARSPFPL